VRLIANYYSKIITFFQMKIWKRKGKKKFKFKFEILQWLFFRNWSQIVKLKWKQIVGRYIIDIWFFICLSCRYCLLFVLFDFIVWCLFDILIWYFLIEYIIFHKMAQSHLSQTLQAKQLKLQSIFNSRYY